MDESPQNNAPFRLGYRRSLDGLRGVAVLTVVAVHASIISDDYGPIGVDVFFALSGFLITCLLIEEWDKTGDISLKNFYIRRGLRLLPALFALLLVFVIYSFFADTRPHAIRNSYEALRALLYFTNWTKALALGYTGELEHTWSLSIEEQFYLLWPPLLVLALSRTSRTSLLNFTFLAAFISLSVRVLLCLGSDPAAWRLYGGLDTRADALLLGCMAGIATSSNILKPSSMAATALKYASWISIPGLFALGHYLYKFDPRNFYWGWFLAHAFSALLVLSTVVSSGGFLNRALELPALVYIGQISYGLYLWHHPIFRIIERWQWPWWQRTAVAMPLTIAATLICFYFIERPCLQLKKRFEVAERAATPGAPRVQNRKSSSVQS